MIKIYAKTLNPELFDYRIYDISEDDYNEVFISGGREYCDIDNKNYLRDIKKVIEEYDSWSYEYYYQSSIKDFLEDMLPKKENGKKLSPKEMHIIETSLKNEKDEVITCLSIITGKKYHQTYLRGCCQGEVVTAYYPETISKQYIDFIEAWFFGTGTEIEIDDSDKEEIDSPEDIEGFTFYTATWGIENLKLEIKRECGYKDEDEVEVILWLYDKTIITKHDTYKRAE